MSERQIEIGATKAELEYHPPRTCIVTVSGEIDTSSASPVTDFILGNLRPEEKAIALNMADLYFMDSSGVRLLATLAQKVGMENVAAYRMRGHVHRVVEITLDHRVTVLGDPEEFDAWLLKQDQAAA